MIRLYQQNDLDDVISVFLSAIRETGSRYYSPSQVDAWARVDRDLWERRRMEKPTWIAELEGQVAGFTDLEPDGHVDMLFVHPKFGGRGVASRLLFTAETYARENGIDRLYTEASLAARTTFERAGFDVIEQEIVHRNGEDFIRFKMQKFIMARPQ
ncbi:GNAT family N-acetyltransferase [Rhizobiales bacterium RZME27]|uniref:GNAT family N-acetyltransferase n=1 Tax=Endobacterium cereale TaxID=2663029 RepID=A0A6A8A442_9HYPH|nr:GNAT family N-acetyltransferase [Endobacterium cereale]MEB2846510.1 GNAT family N-acetyltransferase [Endobacterium cereale]MQY45384.1 GNAT family N-acetyltransferase [Endobacterium cereale]